MKSSIKPMLYALAFAAGCSAPLAFADTITFDNADLTGVAVRPTIFTTQGFVFTAIDLELIGGGVEPYSNGTNVLKFGPRDKVSGMDINAITFRRQDAALFNLNSLEFSPGAYAGNNAKMGITGVFADGTTTSGFLTWHNSSGLTHVDLEDWTNLASVVLTGNLLSQSYVQVDNINVSAVPEPTTYAMLFAGLGLLGIVARRAQRA
ncbi:PEP-CTERM sorting domain-containing protein [Rugamonas aquatica]|uniref:PEP-CTERM sorting domain-containing protein n=1 Tax=Rugamonas aquatica TaxID=2743357 RepID=A0A6A7N4D7_9BURK|nr:PEP-CTERM sorting domain-containing protein [Rugamonas aquatica]MQA39974.1 PEP-CTERM sorting domain-containing protein [Rugamonas aquatica]